MAHTGAEIAEIAALTGHSPGSVMKMLDVYLPATAKSPPMLSTSEA